MKRNALFALILLASSQLIAQETSKKGYNIGALPAVSYNSDEGFQYGAVVNLFNYGDGSRYPTYNQSYYLEASKYTKGSTVLRFYFDSDCLLKGIRTFFDLSYITEDMLDFYGFNGYESTYSPNILNPADPASAESSRAFYKMSQKQLRLLADFRGKLPIDHFYWEASYHFVHYKNTAIDYNKLNKGLSSTNPDYLTPGQSLYEKYVDWGLLNSEEADGGVVNALKAGFVYDTRSALNNPDRGCYSEAILEVAPSFLNESPYARYSLMHKQYQSIIKNKLNLAVRLGVQGKLGKDNIPFYRLPVLMTPFANRTCPTALGGANSLRGILRNRVVGETFALGNFELRWKAVKFEFIKQHWYLGVNGFFDTGYIIDPVDWDLRGVSTVDQATYFNTSAKDGLHSAVGGGLKIVMNENFIVSVELGTALDERDGSGMSSYINLNYLF
jgi:outer membrane protein assembly factor BamA